MLKEDDFVVGYWPSEVLPSLKDGGDQVVWGGEVYSNSDEFPPMGSGIFDFKNYEKRNCYFRRVKVGTKHPHYVPFHSLESGHYYARGHSQEDDYWRFTFYFGGESGRR